jgi:hypothetical protein
MPMEPDHRSLNGEGETARQSSSAPARADEISPYLLRPLRSEMDAAIEVAEARSWKALNARLTENREKGK